MSAHSNRMPLGHSYQSTEISRPMSCLNSKLMGKPFYCVKSVFDSFRLEMLPDRDKNSHMRWKAFGAEDALGRRHVVRIFRHENVRHEPLERPKRWICAVVKRLDGDGFLITTFPTDAIKEGEQIWNK